MELIEIAKRTVDKCIKAGASQAEASAFLSDGSLTRYTKNIIHQNVTSIVPYVNIEVVYGKNKLGSSAINSLEEKQLDLAIERALKIAKVSSPDDEFVSLLDPKPVVNMPELYNKNTASVTPEDRVEAVRTLITTAMDYDKRVKWSAGSYAIDDTEFAISNSQGVEAHMRKTTGTVEINTRAGPDIEEGMGWCSDNSLDVKDFDYTLMAEKAADDAVKSIKPKTIDIGEYEVILTPASVSTFTGFIGMLGFSAKSYQEGYSFLTDQIGKQVFDKKLTIVDDGRSLDTYNAAAFDGEGHPKEKISLINKGVPENLVYDNYHARKDGVESTGHALPKFARGFFYRGVPLPVNMIVAPGDASIDEMIEETKRGVYLTRLHYVNPIRRDKAVISGLTRDACWYIEDGEIKHSIKVMRFTDAIPKVMGNIDLMGDSSTIQKLGSVTTPAIKVASYKFTGQSEF